MHHCLLRRPHATAINKCKHVGLTKRLGFLRRNLRGCPYKLRELAYTTMLRSTLEYCGAVWDPTTQEEENQLEMVQRKAARWSRGARGIVSATELLNDLGWQKLANRRKQQRLCLFYSILYGHLYIVFDHVIQLA